METEDQKCYNQLRFYTSEGEYLGFHTKILVCGTLTQPPQGEINFYAVHPLKTLLYHGIQIGGLICNDMWANPCYTPGPDPHLDQQLANLRAKIILHAVNGGSRDESDWSILSRQYHEANLRMRARGNKIWIVTVDNCYPLDSSCSSPSGVINPEGNWVCRTKPKGEQFFSYTIELP